MKDDVFSPVETKPSLPVAQLVTGSVLVVIGVGWLLSALDVATIPWGALLAGILIVIGIALATAAANGAAPGGLVGTGITLVVLLALLSTANSAFSVPLRGGVGERDLNPTTATLQSEYRLIAGQLDLGLGGVSFPVGETRIEATVTFGELVIYDIPDDVAVRVNAAATAGEIVLFGSTRSGVGLDEHSTDGGFEDAARRVVIDTAVVFGQIEVRR